MSKWLQLIGAVVAAVTTAILTYYSKLKEITYAGENTKRRRDIDDFIDGLRAEDNEASERSDADSGESGESPGGGGS